MDAEQQALKAGKSRKEAIYAAYDRFYKGDIAQEFVRGSRELGGLHTMEDLANWKVHVEEPVATSYKGIDVYKLTTWVQGPVMLQALNMLEPIDLKAMGYNSARYIHALYQVMNLTFADRDFYYGDPYLPPATPIKGLLSKDYARERAKGIRLGEERSRGEARRSVPVPGSHEPVHGAARQVAAAAAEADRRRGQPVVRGGVHGGHDLDRGGRRGRLGGVGHAERRLDSRDDRRHDRHRHEPADAGLRARRSRCPPSTSSRPGSGRDRR